MPRRTRSSGEAPGIKALYRFFSTVLSAGSVTSAPQTLCRAAARLSSVFSRTSSATMVLKNSSQSLLLADPLVGVQHPDHRHAEVAELRRSAG